MRPHLRAAIMLICGLAVMPTAGPAVAASSPTFDTITWGHGIVSATGTAMVLQTLSVHVTDTGQFASNCWEFVETRTGGAGTLPASWSVAKLASGTDADGTWTTSFYLPSTADGTWSVTSAIDCSDASFPAFAVSGSPTFAVTGHHQPRITWGYVPNPVPLANPYVTIKGRVYDADTGAGLAGIRLGRAEDTYCINGIGDGSTTLQHLATTNSNGYYAIASSRDNPFYLQCLGVYGTRRINPDGFAVFVWSREAWFNYLPAVSAAAASSSVPHGTIDTVSGTVIGTPRCPIRLQRLHGSTAWRTVNSGYVRASGRYTLSAQPPSVGRFIYRTYYPAACRGDVHQVAASSPRFTITGT
jgi:hypothetical protein